MANAITASAITLSDRQTELRNAQVKLLKAGKAKGDEVYGKMLDMLAHVNEELKGLLEDSTPPTKQHGNHTPGTITTVILAPLYEGQEIGVGETDGTATIAQAKDVFPGYIDGDFKNWGTDVPSEATQAQLASIYEMRQNANFATMFGSLGRPRDSLFWTQGQIIQFCRDHRDKLLDAGYGNFFPFKAKTEKGVEDFVARVRVFGRGLGAGVYRFGYPRVWDAGSRPRVVLPQLQGAQTL